MSIRCEHKNECNEYPFRCHHCDENKEPKESFFKPKKHKPIKPYITSNKL